MTKNFESEFVGSSLWNEGLGQTDYFLFFQVTVTLVK